ncbi:hypothetical protein D3C81_26540 [compost metagenome]
MSGGGYALPGLQIHLALLPGANQNVGWRLRLTRPTTTSRFRRPGKRSATGQFLRRFNPHTHQHNHHSADQQ